MSAIHIRNVKFKDKLVSYEGLSTFKPSLPDEWFYLGPIAISVSAQSQEGRIVKAGEEDALADVVGWEKVGPHNEPESPPPFSTWRGIAPDGYVVVGDFFVLGNDTPTTEQTAGIKAIRKDIVSFLQPQHLVWTGKQPGRSLVTLWDVIAAPANYFPTGAFVSNDDDTTGDRMMAVLRIDAIEWYAFVNVDSCT